MKIYSEVPWEFKGERDHFPLGLAGNQRTNIILLFLALAASIYTRLIKVF